MQVDNATNLDRKSGVPGKMMICFQKMMICFHCFLRRAHPDYLQGTAPILPRCRYSKSTGGATHLVLHG